MVQWVKNLTSVAQIPVEVQVRSLAQHNGLKDLVLLQLWHKSQLCLGFSPWPGKLPYATGAAVIFFFKGVKTKGKKEYLDLNQSQNATRQLRDISGLEDGSLWLLANSATLEVILCLKGDYMFAAEYIYQPVSYL